MKKRNGGATRKRLGLSHFLMSAKPTSEAEGAQDLEWAVVSVWVLERDAVLAEEYARGYVEDHGWVVLEVTSRHQPSRRQLTNLSELESTRCLEACTHGIAATFVASPKVGGKYSAPEEGLREVGRLGLKPNPKAEADFWRHVQGWRRVKLAKFCLHPQASDTACNQVVRAHSVQRGGGLLRIAREGHVYRIDGDAATLWRQGRMQARLIGIGDASTFTGMCGVHDNIAFEAIEKRPFGGSLEQCFLFAYRCILREMYTKQVAAQSCESLLEVLGTQPKPRQTALRPAIMAFVKGTQSGLQLMARHKRIYDNMLLAGDWGELRFVLIRFGRVPDVMIASAWCPLVDLDGNLLENAARLASPHAHPDLTTISSFPWGDGGALLLAWHSLSDPACEQLAASLVSVPMERLSDAIVRMAFQMSENVFLRPEWWDGLSDVDRDALLERMADSADPMAPIESDALTDDGRSVAAWEPSSIRLRTTRDGKPIVIDSEAPWVKP